MGHDQDPRYTSADAELIKHKVKRIVFRYGLPTSDREDLEQEVAWHVAMQMGRHDPSRASRATFVDRIAGNKLANLIQRQTALKRGGHRRPCLIHEDEGQHIADPGDHADWDTRLDVAVAVASLPPDLHQVAVCLMTHSPTETQGILGLTRGQVRHRMGLIAKHFAGIFPDLSNCNNQPNWGSGR